MKYVMRYKNQVFDEGRWQNIGIYQGETLTNDPTERTENYTVSNFADLQKFADQFYGLSNSETFFHKPCVKIIFGLCCEGKITEKKFKSLGGEIQFRKVYTSFSPTMEWLVKNLSADDFAQYAKDRGWNIMVGK